MIGLRRLVWDAWNLAHVARHGAGQEEVEAVCHGDPILYRKSYKGRPLPPGEAAAGRVPAFRNTEEAAAFRDTRSVTDVPDELDPGRARVAKRLSAPLTVRLAPADRAELARRAREQGTGPSTLVRMWVKERPRRDADIEIKSR